MGRQSDKCPAVLVDGLQPPHGYIPDVASPEEDFAWEEGDDSLLGILLATFDGKLIQKLHLQVKELAVPPVDDLGCGVGPGHIDDVYGLVSGSLLE